MFALIITRTDEEVAFMWYSLSFSLNIFYMHINLYIFFVVEVKYCLVVNEIAWGEKFPLFGFKKKRILLIDKCRE